MQSNRLYGPQNVPGAAGSVALNTSGAVALGPLPSLLTIATTAETVVTNPQLPTSALILPVPPGGPLEQERFEIYASGYVNCAASSTVAIKLYSGTSTTVGSDTLLGNSGALGAVLAKYPWFLSANMIFDSISGKLQGTIKFVANNVIVAEVAVSNVVTGVNNVSTLGVAIMNFVISVTFGTANAGNQFNVKEFAINF
jgi:hypothetical protein